MGSESRQEIFAAYYSMTSHAQDVYLCGCITSAPPKLVSSASDSHRDVSCVYSVNVSGEKIRVCKKAFQNVHVISESKVNHLVQQLKCGQVTASQSKRGHHCVRPNRIPELQRQKVQDHIKSFPAERSHYSRARNSNRMYLPSTLSVNAMYNEYARSCAENNEKAVSGSMYRNIFNTEFNLGFHREVTLVVAVKL